MSDWKTLDEQAAALYTMMAGERKQNMQQIAALDKLFTAWGLPKETTTILDAASGNGVRAVGLHQRGWVKQSVSDGAEAMVAAAKELRDKEGATFPVELMDWTTLGDQCRAAEGFKEPFDVATIVGCSLIMMSPEHYPKLFKDLFGLVKPGGRFVFDTRWWIEKAGMVQQPGAPHGEDVFLGEYPLPGAPEGTMVRVTEHSTYGEGTQRKTYSMKATAPDGTVLQERKDYVVFNLHSCTVATMIQMMEAAGFTGCEVHTRGTQSGDEDAKTFTELGYIYALVSAQRPLE
jgi:SAM-dependent methyltransferase